MVLDPLAAISAAANIATAVGVLFAAQQVRLSRDQARTSFEDSLTKEFRDLISRIPAKVFFGHELSDEEFHANLDDLYRYLDLSNEQCFLYLAGRVSERTWREWEAGILRNLARPAFRRVWELVEATTPVEEFDELRRLLRDRRLTSGRG